MAMAQQPRVLLLDEPTQGSRRGDGPGSGDAGALPAGSRNDGLWSSTNGGVFASPQDHVLHRGA